MSRPPLSITEAEAQALEAAHIEIPPGTIIDGEAMPELQSPPPELESEPDPESTVVEIPEVAIPDNAEIIEVNTQGKPVVYQTPDGEKYYAPGSPTYEQGIRTETERLAAMTRGATYGIHAGELVPEDTFIYTINGEPYSRYTQKQLEKVDLIQDEETGFLTPVRSTKGGEILLTDDQVKQYTNATPDQKLKLAEKYGLRITRPLYTEEQENRDKLLSGEAQTVVLPDGGIMLKADVNMFKKDYPEIYTILIRDGYGPAEKYIDDYNRNVARLNERAEVENQVRAATRQALAPYAVRTLVDGEVVDMVDGVAWLRDHPKGQQRLRDAGFTEETIAGWSKYAELPYIRQTQQERFLKAYIEAGGHATGEDSPERFKTIIERHPELLTMRATDDPVKDKSSPDVPMSVFVQSFITARKNDPTWSGIKESDAILKDMAVDEYRRLYGSGSIAGSQTNDFIKSLVPGLNTAQQWDNMTTLEKVASISGDVGQIILIGVASYNIARALNIKPPKMILRPGAGGLPAGPDDAALQVPKGHYNIGGGVVVKISDIKPYEVGMTYDRHKVFIKAIRSNPNLRIDQFEAAYASYHGAELDKFLRALKKNPEIAKNLKPPPELEPDLSPLQASRERIMRELVERDEVLARMGWTETQYEDFLRARAVDTGITPEAHQASRELWDEISRIMSKSESKALEQKYQQEVLNAISRSKAEEIERAYNEAVIKGILSLPPEMQDYIADKSAEFKEIFSEIIKENTKVKEQLEKARLKAVEKSARELQLQADLESASAPKERKSGTSRSGQYSVFPGVESKSPPAPTRDPDYEETIETQADADTRKDQEKKTGEKTGTGTKTAPDPSPAPVPDPRPFPLPVPAPATSVQTKTKTAPATQTKTDIKPAIQPLTKTETETRTRTAIAPDIARATAQAVDTRVATSTATLTTGSSVVGTPGPSQPPETEPRKPRPRIKPRSGSGRTDEEKRRNIRTAQGAVTMKTGELKQGDVWHTWTFNPYAHYTVIGKKPDGALEAEGPGSAYATAQRIQGIEIPDEFSHMIGFMQAKFKRTRGGDGVAVAFDPETTIKGRARIKKTGATIRGGKPRSSKFGSRKKDRAPLKREKKLGLGMVGRYNKDGELESRHLELEPEND